jgi:hypothetical protein
VDFTTSERFTQVIEQIVQRQFADDDAQTEEAFEVAPEPVVKAPRETRAAASKRSLADEAAALAGDESVAGAAEQDQDEGIP